MDKFLKEIKQFLRNRLMTETGRNIRNYNKLTKDEIESIILKPGKKKSKLIRQLHK